MSKRPPRRNGHRDPPPPETRLPVVLIDLGASAGPSAPAVAASPAPAQPPLVRNRDELAGLLDDLRRQGGLDVADEAAILREYDGLLGELQGEKSRLEAEFRERVARDGQERTDAWLAEAAAALGRRQGEQVRRLMQTIPGFTSGQPAAG